MKAEYPTNLTCDISSQNNQSITICNSSEVIHIHKLRLDQIFTNSHSAYPEDSFLPMRNGAAARFKVLHFASLESSTVEMSADLFL